MSWLTALIAAAAFAVNAYATLKTATQRRLQNYLEIIRSHRDLWRLTLDDAPKYERILSAAPDLDAHPVTDVERRFVNLLLLHITCAYQFAKANEMVPIDKLKYDIDDVMALPIPRALWSESRHYFNADFVEFVEQRERRPSRQWDSLEEPGSTC